MGLEQIQVELQDFFGSDASIANAAWTSTYNKDTRENKLESADKVRSVLRMLANVENPTQPAHGVPFESVIFRFWLRIPIFTDRQHATHRIQSMNGLSGRYRTMPEDFYTPPDDVVQICKKASGRSFITPVSEYITRCEEANKLYREHLSLLRKAESAGDITNSEYKRAREVLRGMLPQAGMTERTTIMNLRSFANYQRQRNDDHAQPEIRHVAQQMLAQVEAANVCPIALECIKERGWMI